RRAAEFAALADALGVEDGDRLTTLTLDRDLLGLPPAHRVGNVAQRGDEVVLDDDRLVAVLLELGGRFGAPVRANERALGGLPDRFGAAGGTRELLAPCRLAVSQRSP